MLIRLLSLLLLLVSSATFAEIQQTSNFDPIIKEVYKSSKDTLVIFDVDGVLITNKDQIFANTDSKALSKINADFASRHTKEERDNLWGIILSSSQVQLVDPKILSILKSIHNHVNNVIAFTNMGTGKVGKIDSVEDWRINGLKSFGIVFNSTFPNTIAKQLDHLLSKPNPRCSPLFKDGILFGCYLSKGDVLQAYLKYAAIKPTKIIFIDDTLENLKTVAEYCKKNNILFEGFEYTAVKEKNWKPFSVKRAQLQFDILERTHVWLSDDLVDEILHNLKCK